MTRKYRLTFLSISLVILITTGRILTSDFTFLTGQLWFTSGLLLLILLSIIDQPFFSKDSQIFLNGIAGALSLLTVSPDDRDYIYVGFCVLVGFLILTSYSLMWIREYSLGKENRLFEFLSRLNQIIGRPDSLFSSFFLWGAFLQFDTGSKEFNGLLLFWVLFILLNTPTLSQAIERLLTKRIDDPKIALGRLFGVQSDDAFLVRLFPINKRYVRHSTFDFVEFKYSINKSLKRGLILDSYYLNDQQWIKILSNDQINKVFGGSVLSNHLDDVVYRLQETPPNSIASRFVGLITEYSKIGKIKFTYNSRVAISEGQLLEVEIDNEIVLYQVTEAETKTESLESYNQSSLIVGEAVQLGLWDFKDCFFVKYGWVPKINSVVLAASTEIKKEALEFPEYLATAVLSMPLFTVVLCQ